MAKCKSTRGAGGIATVTAPRSFVKIRSVKLAEEQVRIKARRASNVADQTIFEARRATWFCYLGEIGNYAGDSLHYMLGDNAWWACSYVWDAAGCKVAGKIMIHHQTKDICIEVKEKNFTPLNPELYTLLAQADVVGEDVVERMRAAKVEKDTREDAEVKEAKREKADHKREEDRVAIMADHKREEDKRVQAAITANESAVNDIKRAQAANLKEGIFTSACEGIMCNATELEPVNVDEWTDSMVAGIADKATPIMAYKPKSTTYPLDYLNGPDNTELRDAVARALRYTYRIRISRITLYEFIVKCMLYAMSHGAEGHEMFMRHMKPTILAGRTSNNQYRLYIQTMIAASVMLIYLEPM